MTKDTSGRAPSRAFEPELPEAVARVVGCRIPDECNDQISTKLEPGTLLYTSRQMHDHFQAGVRAGAAGSQDAKLISLLKEARKIIRASSSRNLVKDWDQRATAAMQGDKQ